MIEIPIVDTHLHIWDITNLNYPWLDDVLKLNKTFLIDDYREATEKLNIEKMVFIQCEAEFSQYKQEVEWVTHIAQNEEKRIKGIVSWAPLEKGEAAREDLDYLKQNPLVKGIRRIIQFEPDMEFCLKPDFIKGVKLLAEYGYTFDICIAYMHNKNTLKFIEQIPEVPMILDHIGKPGIKESMLDPWQDEIKQMASFPNVYCKVSSLATEADHDNWTTDDLRPYVDAVFEAFTFDRAIFAGDWPVSTLAASYETCVNTLEELIKGCSKEEQKKLFHDNAEKFYKI